MGTTMKMASRLIDLISKKTNCTCSKLFLITKNKFARATRFFVFPLPLFCTTTTLFCTTKTSNFLVTHYFYGGIVLTQYFVSCVHVRFYFSLPLIFTWPGRQHFPFSHRRFEFPCFSSYEIRLLCFQLLALALSLLSTLV